MRWPEDRALEAFDAQAATALNRLAAAAAVLVAGVLALLLLTAPAAATTYYVTTSGGGTHSGADSTTNPMTVAEANAAAVAGDVIQFKSGATTGTINPARSGTNASRITYRGFPAWPGACVITGGVTLDSTSATDSGRYISVSGLTFTTGFSGGDTGFYTARWDSLTKCIFGNGGSVCGGYNFLTDCTFGDGTVGDAFSWTYAGGTGSDYYKSFAAKGNKALCCTFNLQITGSTNSAIQIRC